MSWGILFGGLDLGDEIGAQKLEEKQLETYCTFLRGVEEDIVLNTKRVMTHE